MSKILQLPLIAILSAALPLALMGQKRAQLDTTVRLDLGGTVDLSLVSGKIRVRGWDLAYANIHASTETGTVRFDATPNRVTVRVEQRGPRGANPSASASYDVSVPRGTHLRLNANSGNITASGSQGEISATTVSASIDISGGRRQVSVESVSGPVRVTQLAGDLRAQSVSGNLRAENISGPLEAWTVSGTITLIGVRGNYIHGQTVSGDMVYAGRLVTGGSYDFESHSGTIRLTIPQNSGAHFSLETVGGAVQSDFAVDTGSAGQGRKAGRVEFTIGDGRADVTARTFSGRIVIRSDAASSVRSAVVPIIRGDSGSAARRDSVPTIRRDSSSTSRRDSVEDYR
ncbi:MAG: DUF4097 family beta strand repeat-containing protein [Gemmatimonadaceae bacterium]